MSRRLRALLAFFALALCGCVQGPADGTGGGPPGLTCQGSGETAQTTCEELTHVLTLYGCPSVGPCNASCSSSSDVVCTSEIDACRSIIADTLNGVVSADLPAACQQVEDACNSALVCHPLD